jgi:hypothetical protein
MYLNDVKNRTHWDTLLKLAAWVHNSSTHEALKASPYEIVTGTKPNVARMWLPGETDTVSEDAMHEYFGIKQEKLDELRQQAKEAIKRAQAGHLAKQHKRDGYKYKIGDMVWVKNHQATKWQPRYFGPFKIYDVVSDVIIQIILNQETGKKDCVHVDYCKPYISRDGSPAIGKLPITDNGESTEEDVINPSYYYPDETSSEIIVEGTNQQANQQAELNKMTPRNRVAVSQQPTSEKTPSPIRSAYRSIRRLFESEVSEPRSEEIRRSASSENQDLTQSSHPSTEQSIEFTDLPAESDPPRYFMRTRGPNRAEGASAPRRRNADQVLLDENIEKGISPAPATQGRITRSKKQVQFE